MYKTVLGAQKRLGNEAGYQGKTKSPPEDQHLATAYLTGYAIGQAQRQLEIEEGTHPSLMGGVKYKPHRHYPVRRKTA